MAQSSNLKPNACVVGTSDVCSRDPTRDTIGGQVVADLKSLNLFRDIKHLFVSNDYAAIKQCIKKALVDYDPILIVTIGGTGMRPRDVTPDVTSSLYDKHCSGIVTALHMTCLRYNPGAALMRLTAGTIEGCLVINLPANEKACRHSFDYLEGIIEQAIEQVRDQIGMKYKFHQTPRQSMDDNINHIIRDRSSSMQRDASKSQKRYVKRETSNAPSNKSKNQQQQLAITNEAAPNNSRNVLEGLLAKVQSGAGIKSPKSTLSGDERSSTSGQKNTAIKLTESKIVALNSNVKVIDRSNTYRTVEYEDVFKIMFTNTANIFKEENSDLTKRPNASKILFSHALAQDLEAQVSSSVSKVSTCDGYVVLVPSGLSKVFNTIGLIQAHLIKNMVEFEKLCSDPDDEYKVYCCPVKKGQSIPNGDIVIVPADKAECKPKDRITLSELQKGAYISECLNRTAKQVFIRKGTIVGPIELGMMLSLGLTSIKTWSKPKVGILPISDDIKNAFDTERQQIPGKVDIVSPVLSSILGNMHKYPVTHLGNVGFKTDEISSKLSNTKCGAIICISDRPGYVASIIEQKLNGRVIFGQVNMKPGGMVAFCVMDQDQEIVPVFSMPFDPYSTCMATLTLVLPFLERSLKQFVEPNSAGLELIGQCVQIIVLNFVSDDDDDNESYACPEKTEFLRAKIVAEPLDRLIYPVSVFNNSSNNQLQDLKDFDCLIPPTTTDKSLSIGDRLTAYKLYKTF